MNNQRQHNRNGTSELLCINVAGMNDRQQQNRSWEKKHVKGGRQFQEESLMLHAQVWLE